MTSLSKKDRDYRVGAKSDKPFPLFNNDHRDKMMGTMNRIEGPKKFVLFACLLVCVEAMISVSAAQGPPLASVEHVTLNPSNFIVSVRITNTILNRYFCLMAYDGPPVGLSTGAPRVRVSDCYEGLSDSIVLIDISAPLSHSGRTYAAGLAPDMSSCSNPVPEGMRILGANECYAPYPFFSNTVIMPLRVLLTDSNVQVQATYGEALYTNTVCLFETNELVYYRIRGTNNVPTNTVIERSVDMINWTN